TLLRSAELQGTNPVENLLAIAKNALTVKTPSGLDYKIAS
ncbi:MAG: Transposase family protein, partial [Planctomycetota bacterium]|nr:Transposase family protein [Planctomycetota bacterium]